MNKKRITGFFIAISFFAFETNQAQDNYQLPTILHPSPAVQNFLRYGEIPVDYSTGVPSISVPLYTVKSRKLELPISISYHGSGIKVEDRASVVGLGWVLNAGGLVAASIISKPDPMGYSPGQVSWANSDSFYNALSAVDKTCFSASSGQPDSFMVFGVKVQYNVTSKDWVSDRYTFQLPDGESGVFRYDFHTHQIIKLPYSPIRIHADTAGSDHIIPTFTLTDIKGVTYVYKLPPDYPSGINLHNNWDLTTIISADKSDTIRLVYKYDQNIYYTLTYESRLQYGDEVFGLPDYPYFNWTDLDNFNNSASPNSLYTCERVLDSIISSTTVVKFSAVADRADMPSSFGKFRVNKFSVYDRSSSNLIKDFVFDESYFGSSTNNNQRLRLDSLSIRGSDTLSVERYKFKYDTLHQLPPYESSGVFSEDFWGYYNGTGSYSLIPYQFIPDSFYSSAGYIHISSYDMGNRDLDSIYAKTDLLNEIDYPTGGKTTFDFEPNHAAAAHQYPGETMPQPDVVGGFRIKRISNYSDSLTLANYKTYTYSEGNTRTIQYDLYTYAARTFWGSTNSCILQYVSTITNNLSSPFLPLTCDNGPPVFYDQVTEYEGDTTGVIGKTVYSYETPPITQYSSYDQIRFQDPYEYDRGNYIPKLIRKDIYKKQSSQYIPVQRTMNYYTSFLSQSYFMGIHAVQTADYPSANEGLDYFMCPSLGCVLYDNTDILGYPYYFKMFDLWATQEINPLTESIVYDYSADTSQKMTTTTVYTYDTTSHIQPIEKIFINSKSDSLKTIFKYPKDFSGTAVYDSMLSRNIISPVVEQDNYKNSSFLQSSKTNYHDWGNNLIAPQTIESKKLSNSSETRIRFNSYDSKGNIITVSKENDIKNSYIWDYSLNYPIAEVKNADSSSIAYTSFEADGKGNWSFSGSASSDSTSVTGTKCYNLSGGNVTKSGLSSNTYIVSYWGKSGSATVNSGSPTRTGRSVGNWTYYEHEVTGTSITISGSHYVDEVRLYPKAALMTTYTYTSLIGITSQCDVNNRITYFDYDNFNRLLYIHDQDKNIIKRFCYNYAGQAESCPVYNNVSKSGSYVRNNCSSGYVGDTVLYTVQANTYYSTISQAYVDSVAQANVNANGQAYANANGGCNPTPATITSYNTSGFSGFSVVYTNKSTSVAYTFTIPSTAGAQSLGTVPTGLYNVTISKSGNSTSLEFYLGNTSFGTNYYNFGTGALFKNVSVDASTNNVVTLNYYE